MLEASSYAYKKFTFNCLIYLFICSLVNSKHMTGLASSFQVFLRVIITVIAGAIGTYMFKGSLTEITVFLLAIACLIALLLKWPTRIT